MHKGELVNLDKLYRATQNVNIPLSERNKIVDELQKKYPAYFGNLSNEAVLAGKAADAYYKLREGIIAAATSRAIDKQLEEQGSKMVDLIAKQNQLRKSVADAAASYKVASNELAAFNERNKDANKLATAEQYSLLQAKGCRRF